MPERSVTPGDGREGETKRGPSGRTIGIDGIEPHARSSCPLPFATACPYCVPDGEWAALVAATEAMLRG